ncbi:ABC transporter ATP-binding protein [Polynucleobacter sp. UB-Raua-W9]|uniref:ABC transporter ATP-binding protein n=1 Tax=Polynucleobacter sp. UB-Raua-W9 TaxID=1819736 RepID=UPI001BFE3359|nr:ABC transporter ATP-binding protein [Polynucleobacter sp. UB-Raua-W9]QWD72718.1 ABC transporter ATP-binding protein [Polynucleobacter sp. UB-Raua-W9]
MAIIALDKLSVEFPIFSAGSRSLKNTLMKVATGGQLSSDSNGRTIVRSLNNLTFKLSDGDRVGLIGHNGSGKSTLLRVLNGVYEPTKGKLRVDGSVASLIDLSLGIDSEATGRQNIFIRAALLGIDKSTIAKKLEEIIDFSELGDFIDMPVRTYSSGMHLRLAFSVSTIVRPQILLLDEWLSVGDENFRLKAEVRMKEMVESTNILVLASHSKELILDVCNRVIWLEHGGVKMDGSPEEIISAYFN